MRQDPRDGVDREAAVETVVPRRSDPRTVARRRKTSRSQSQRCLSLRRHPRRRSSQPSESCLTHFTRICDAKTPSREKQGKRVQIQRSESETEMRKISRGLAKSCSHLICVDEIVTRKSKITTKGSLSSLSRQFSASLDEGVSACYS